MRITERKYLDAYVNSIGNGIPKLIEGFEFSENKGGFEYLTKSSAVYSSNIEGNSIDLNSYMNYEMNKDKFKVGKEIEEIEDLIEAYEFAQNNILNEKNLKSNVNKQYKDGMDISLIAINKPSEGSEPSEGLCKVSYAGANNPLWIVTENHHFKLEEGKSKTYEDSPLTLWEVKADKQPIGLYDHEKPFTTHTFQLSEGDRIYMFSDGFQDQFGGEDLSETKKGGKKFKSANFKKLLLSYYDKSMAHQKTSLESTFDKWKGDLEQIDDVCIIGVRL